MLGVLVTILTVILVFISLLMSLVILMQRPKQEGLGAAFGGALTDRMLGSGTTDFLQRSTVFMGVAFFVLSLTIATIMAYDRNNDRQSQLEQVKEAAQGNAAAEDPAPGAPPAGAPDVDAPPSINVGTIPTGENAAEAPPVIDLGASPAGENADVPPVDENAADDPPADEDAAGDPPATGEPSTNGDEPTPSGDGEGEASSSPESQS